MYTHVKSLPIIYIYIYMHISYVSYVNTTKYHTSDIRPVTLVVPLSNSGCTTLFVRSRTFACVSYASIPEFFLRGPLDLRVYWVRAEAFLV